MTIAPHPNSAGLIIFGYRDYDPAIGRFLTPDPMGYNGGASPFPSNLPLTFTIQVDHII
ncbi:RHS repeat-associated core domain-containing protein [Maridesulfovibrio frigidus]|uniref:RHS repeat-associated core domain-containing protein n=1 Tax=Maridesulfovibrio frigidus TaxID=340956 RepID=UPI0012EC7704